jgi:hypothetical protein
MMNDDVKAVLAHEGSATLVTTAGGEPHLVATWQSYIRVLDESTVAFPAGGMRKTEENVRAGSNVQMVIGAKGLGKGSGTGYRLTGTARFESGTPAHERLKQDFPWCRAAVLLSLTGVEKILG